MSHLLMKKITTAAVLVGVGLVLSVGTPAIAWADDWEVDGGDDRQQRIIDRYQSMLEESPEEGRTLDSLLGHVGRGAGLDRLIAEYEQRVEARPNAVNLRLLLGHLLKARGDYEEAYEEYEQAVELDRDRSLGWLSRGKASLLLGERRRAMEDFEEALQRERSRSRRHEILQELGELSFSQREFDRGKEFFDRLLQDAPRDRFVRMEYVRLLVQYRQLDEAIEQYDVLLRLVADDPRERATMLRDKADVYEMQGDVEKALSTYEEAKGLVRSDSWLARAIRQHIVELFRQSGRLEEFLEQYATRWERGDSAQQMMIADVYAEVGKLDEALELYQRFARRDRRAVEPREKIIRVFERLGRDDEVPAIYQELMRAAPNDQRYPLDLAEYHMRMGDRDAAASALGDASRRFRNQSYVLLEIAGYYARWNFDEEATRTYARVLDRETDDDAVLIEVGDFYFDRGERRRAIEIWQKLPDSQLGEDRGSLRMAELLVERGVMAEGIATFERLIEKDPDDERLLRAMARALERARRWDDARQRWQELLAVTESPQRQREARSRIVQLYERQQTLRAEVMRWWKTFEDETGSVAIDAGFFLAEAHLRLREADEAEEVLQRLRARDDLSEEQFASTLLLLEQVYVRGEQYEDAIAILKQLSDRRPEMRADLLERKADHALQARADEDAIGYALQSLERNPDDARGQARLGDVYRQVGQLEAAARHYRTATEIDPRAYDTAVKLGQVLEELGRITEAEEALMGVVRDASQSNLVRDAGERMLAMARAMNRLDALEARWAPLVFRMPVREVHARLMFDLYDFLAGPLMLQSYHGSSNNREEASDRLYELGGRSASLLVEQLRRDDSSARAKALRMVAEMEVDLASNQVARIIEGEDDRVRKLAIVAAARLGRKEFVEPLKGALGDGSATVRHLAIWALGFIDADEAREVLIELADADADGTGPQLAMLGLWNATGAQERALVAANLEHLIKNPGGIDRRQAALLFSLASMAVLDGQGDEFRPIVTELIGTRHDRIGSRATVLLANFDDAEAAAILWRLALSENLVYARRGEAGLKQMLSPASPRERTWSDEIRYFDWSRAEFDARSLLRDAGQRWTVEDRVESGEVWSQQVEDGLATVIREETGLNSVRAVLARVGDQIHGSQPDGGLWNQERVRRFAAVTLEQSGEGVIEESTRLVLQMLGGQADSALSDPASADDETLSTILRAITVGGDVGSDNVFEEIFVEALSRGDSGLRRDALKSVETMAADRVVSQVMAEAIIDALNDDDVSVQLAAVRTGGSLRIIDAEPSLEILEREARPLLRRTVREARRSLDKDVEESL